MSALYPIKPASPRYAIDPVAFFIALFGGPLVFTAATFWLLFIPVFALGFGAIPYLFLGTPILLFHLNRHPAQPGRLAGLALITLLALCIPLVALTLLSGEQDVLSVGTGYLLAGMVFGPCWAACFGWIYGKLARPTYARPIPTSFQ